MTKRRAGASQRAPAAPPASRPPSRPRRKAVFLGITLLLPVLFLGVVELGFRLAGFGGYPPIVREVARDGSYRWYATNRAGTDTFFSTGRSHTGGMREIHFTDPKPGNTIRIALLGGSAMQGFPQPLPLTNGAFLETMLEDAWGGTRNVEVLNFGATAVASFPVLKILEAVLEHEPDLVVVMSGNNEFYGAYGVSSLHSAGRSPAGMRFMRRLRGLAIAQWIERLRPAPALPSGKLMERVARKHRIEPDDGLRRSAARTLRANLTAMVRRCRARDVPMIVCTVPTNEGLAPIGDDAETSDVDPGGALKRAASALPDDPESAATLARSVVERLPTHARARFLHGQALSLLGRREESRAELVAARDLDRMPWRATSDARAAVLAAVNEGAILCDMEAAFRAASAPGWIGWDLMDDHVHLSIEGQALFARTIVDALAALPPPFPLPPVPGGSAPTDPDARRADTANRTDRAGRSIYTDYVAAHRMRALFGIPFLRKNNPDAAQRAEERCESLLARMSEPDREAVERWRDPDLHGSTDRPLTYVVGVHRMASGDWETAARLFATARATVPTVSLWRLELTWFLLRCRRHVLEAPETEDLRLCREAIAIGELLDRFAKEGHPDVLRYLGLAYHLAGDAGNAVRCLGSGFDSAPGEDWEPIGALADAYLQTGRPDSAQRLLELAATRPKLEAPARAMLARMANAPTRRDR